MKWEKVRLDDICNVITCGVAKRPEYQESGIPFLSSLNVKENRFILKTFKFISKKDHEQLTKYSKPAKGDILYTRVGSFGEAAVIDLEFEFSIFVSLTLIKPKHELVDSRYLMWHLNSPEVRGFANNNTSGIGVQNLNVGVVREYQIPLPPLSIQKQIAEILDAADALKRKDQELLKKYDELAQAIFIDMFGDPVKNEKGWEVKTISDIIPEGKNKIRSGPFGSDLLHSEFVDEGVFVLGIDNVVNNRFEINRKRFITDEKFKSLSRYQVFPGDVLISVMATIGRAAVVPENIGKAINSKHLVAITPDNHKIDSVFLRYLFTNSQSIKRQIKQKSKGAIMDGLNIGIIKDLNFQLPPIELQKKFVGAIENLENQKVKLESNYSDFLFNSLIQKAFNGELAN